MRHEVKCDIEEDRVQDLPGAARPSARLAEKAVGRTLYGMSVNMDANASADAW